ncbi:MAG: T9SS type A sorting domain-containing protein [Williamsia sp.]|nr:T9SS type A sorting domain-containing protein [Williamsia sp.]
MKKLLLLSMLALLLQKVYSQSAKFDSSFGSGGYINVLENPVSNAFSENATQTLVQPDGGLLVFVAGGTLARYNANGTLDERFGTRGYLKILREVGVMGLLQPDGKIVISGSFHAQRILPSGKLDSAFGEGGTVNFPPDGAFTSEAAALQPDGKIVLAGYYYQPNGNPQQSQQFSLLRYNANGTLDTSFGKGGQVITPTEYTFSDFRQIAIRPDGKLVVTGIAYSGPYGKIQTPGYLLVQYNANGTLDNSFGDTGIVKTNISGDLYGRAALALQADGKIWIGTSLISRYSAGGNLETTFAANFDVVSIIVQTDGKIVAGGTVYVGTTPDQQNNLDFAINRFSSNGTLDGNFHGNGKVTIGINYPDYMSSLTIQPDGKLIAAGSTQPKPFDRTDYVIARINTNGTPDGSFNGSGVIATGIPAYRSGLRSITVQPDGKILAVGGSGYIIHRFNTNGSPDSSFSGAGEIRLPSGYTDKPVLLQPDGKILCLESTGLRRYLPNGSLDSSFGGDGRLEGELLPGFIYSTITAVCVQPDNKLVVTEPVQTGSGLWPALLRVLPDGSPDIGFNGNGKLVLSFPGNFDAIVVQPDGKIVAAGNTPSGNQTAFVVVRYNADGSPDAGFGVAGKVITGFSGYNARATNILVLPGGKLVVAGSASVPNDARFAVAYYNPDGSVDNSFVNGGKRVSATSMAPNITQDGQKFLVAGTIYNGNEYDALIMRYNLNGLPDSSFGTAGKIIIDFGRYDLRPSVATSGNRLYFAETNSFEPDELTDNSGILAAYFPSAGETLPPPTSNGLRYRFYQGVWTSLPDFSTLSPVKTGTTPNIDINVRPSGVNTYYAFVWEGYIRIPAPGDYTFNMVSDDGSRFYFNSFYDPAATPLIDHNGVHYAFGKQATIHVDSAGLYPIAITYFQERLDASIKLYWKGPGIPNQLIPNEAFNGSFQPLPANGLRYRFYQGSWNFLPDFSNLSPVKTGTATNVDINVRPSGENTNYGFVWEGYINIKMPGDYLFETFSDDGSKFYFNKAYANNEPAVIYNDGVHYAVVNKGTVHVDTPGRYPVAIAYFQKEGDAVMEFYWTGPGIPRQRVPDQAFTEGSGSITAEAGPGRLRTSVDIASQSTIKLYPNPFIDRLQIEANNLIDKAVITVELFDAAGKKVFNQVFRNIASGRNTFTVDLQASKYPAGIYQLQVRLNGLLVKTAKVVKGSTSAPQ